MGHRIPQYDTQLFRDMFVCAEILHCSHEEFLRLPLVERKKLYMYLEVKGEKIKYDKIVRDEKYSRKVK